MTNTEIASLTPAITLQELYDIAKAKRDANGGVDYVYVNPSMADPDYRGGSCLYVHGTVPGCLIGAWLHSKGVTLDQLLKSEGSAASSVARRCLPTLPQNVVDVLTGVQVLQDQGSPWMEAVQEVAARLKVTLV